jgi:hypothetical protein
VLPESKLIKDIDCKTFQEMSWVQGLFTIALVYVILSGLQIRYGEPEPTMLYYFTNKITHSMPIFFTSSICLDYMLTPTSLDFFESVKFESIYNNVFESIYKIKSREEMIAGLRIDTTTKAMYGIGGLAAQILLILFPLLWVYNSSSSSQKQILLQNVGLKINLDIADVQMTLW